MDKVVPAFEVSLLEPTFSPILDCVELGIDSVLDNEVLKSIPMVNLVIGIGRAGQNIHDRNLLKQTLNFIKVFNGNQINHEKLEKYKRKINEKPKYAEEELGRVLIILNNTVEVKKSQLLAKVFKAYVEETLNWEEFCEISEVITRLFISDLGLLNKIYKSEVQDTSQCLRYQADRLISLGLINSATKSIMIGDFNNSQTDKYLSINDFGRLFCSLT
ncbi:hypothetical protein ACQQ2T_06605 [Paraclostridium tenue]